MIREGRRRRRDGHAFSVSPALGCVACTSLWSRLCKWSEAKRRSDAFFFCGSHFKLCVTLLLQLQAVLMMGKGGRVIFFLFFILSVSAAFSCWHLPPRLCKWWGMRRDGVIFCESCLQLCGISLAGCANNGRSKEEGCGFFLSVSPVFKQKLQEHLKWGWLLAF